MIIRGPFPFHAPEQMPCRPLNSHRHLSRRFLPGVLLACCLLFSGCSALYTVFDYSRDRVNDSLDMVDIGITISTSAMPHLAAYVDYFTLTPLGLSYVEGKFLGIGGRRIGLLDYESKSLGLLLYGTEKMGIGRFNPLDPYQALSNQRDLPTRPRFDSGLAGYVFGPAPAPGLQVFEGKRMIHLGWLGIVFNFRLAEMADFLLGWTTIDIVNDDELDRSPPKTQTIENTNTTIIKEGENHHEQEYK